jgi:hypothetical protein
VLSLAAWVGIAAATFAAALAASKVDVALVLAVDVSDSMDAGELAVQRAGYVAALSHPDFLRAVRQGESGRVALTYFEWAGSARRESVVGWSIIDGPESAARFAKELAAQPFQTFRSTSISNALAFGQQLLAGSGVTAERQVIDISGDGPNNFGPPVLAARDRVLAADITVNGLPILIRPSPTFPEIDRYYTACVIGGPGAFVVPIHTVGEFADAIRRKLVLEVSGGPEAFAAPLPAAAPADVDCAIGERLRRSLSDKFYPELDR